MEHPTPHDEQERYREGVLGRECEAAIAVAAMQRLLALEDDSEIPVENLGGLYD